MIFYYKCFFYLVLSIFDFFLGVDVGFFFVLFVGVYCVGNDFLFDKKKKNGKYDFYKFLILYIGILIFLFVIYNVSNRIILCVLLL